MSEYQIFIYGTVSAVISVEAETYEDAVELAIEQAPSTSFASAEFDSVDEWEAAGGYYKDGEYIESAEATK